jgi:hypothetical protein
VATDRSAGEASAAGYSDFAGASDCSSSETVSSGVLVSCMRFWASKRSLYSASSWMKDSSSMALTSRSN